MKNCLGQFHVKVMYDLCTVSVVLAQGQVSVRYESE